MRDFAGPVEVLIDELRKLPGIGSKSAQRLAFFIVRTPKTEAEKLARQFWSMYNGELGIVENASVKRAMQRFGGALKRWEKANSPGSDFTRPDDFVFQETPTSQREKFADLSYQLSQACREELAAP